MLTAGYEPACGVQGYLRKQPDFSVRPTGDLLPFHGDQNAFFASTERANQVEFKHQATPGDPQSLRRKADLKFYSIVREENEKMARADNEARRRAAGGLFRVTDGELVSCALRPTKAACWLWTSITSMLSKGTKEFRLEAPIPGHTARYEDLQASPHQEEKEVMAMDTAQLKAAVNTVEQDHQLVLEKLQALKDTVYCLMEPAQTTSGEVVARLDEFNNFFATQFEGHLEEEETTLFPLLENHASGGAELVARLRKDHEDIRRKRGEFESCLAIAASLEENIAPSILRDLLRYGLDFWEQLDTHAHFESRELHRCISRWLVNEVA